jgi:hypothetical protein
VDSQIRCLSKTRDWGFSAQMYADRTGLAPAMPVRPQTLPSSTESSRAWASKAGEREGKGREGAVLAELGWPPFFAQPSILFPTTVRDRT